MINEFDQILKQLNENQKIILYGRNNDGKTFLLKKTFEKIILENMRKIHSNNDDLTIVIFLPTQRLKIEEYQINEYKIQEKEIELINQYKNFNNFIYESIVPIRLLAMNDPFFKKIIDKAIFNLFGLENYEISNVSDGVQNRINIYSYIYYMG